MYYTYMLQCMDGTIYTGITTDPERRLREHQEGGRKAAKYTKTHKAQKLIALWQSDNRSLASKLESALKSLTREQKQCAAENGSLAVLQSRLQQENYRYIRNAGTKDETFPACLLPNDTA